MSDAPIPAPNDTDSDDVKLALETAAALWKSEDTVDALRWLRKAAEGSADAGNDMRSVELARCAADLRGSTSVPPRPPAPAALAPVVTPADAPPPSSARTPPPAPPSVAARAAAPPAPAWPPVDASVPTAPVAAVVESSEPAPVPRSDPPPSFPSSATETPLGLGPDDLRRERARREALAAARAGNGSSAAAPVRARENDTQPGQERGPSTPTAVSSTAASPSGATRRATLVAVSPTPSADGTFRVSPINAEHTVAPGWTTALLVCLDETDGPFPGY